MSHYVVLILGIYWEKLSRQKLGQIRVLQDLKKRIERETGQTLPCAPDETLPPLAARKRPPPKGSGKTRNTATASEQTIFMWNVSPSTTKREVQEHVAQLGGDVQTVRTSLKPGNNRRLAWVVLKDGADIGKIVEALDQSTLGEMVVRAKIDEPRSTGKSGSQPQSQ
jgi:hypothetical protein